MINIYKISIAGLSYLVLYGKILVRISFIPLLLILPFAYQLQALIVQNTDLVNAVDINVGILLSVILAIFAYIMLNLNIYRLVILGKDNIGYWGLSINKRFLSFAGYLLLIELLLGLPALLTGLPLVSFIVYILLVPLVLNMIRSALDLDKIQHQIDFITRFKIAILQMLIPFIIIVSIILLLSPPSALSLLVLLVVKFVLNYWAWITLAMIYQQLYPISELEGNT